MAAPLFKYKEPFHTLLAMKPLQYTDAVNLVVAINVQGATTDEAWKNATEYLVTRGFHDLSVDAGGTLTAERGSMFGNFTSFHIKKLITAAKMTRTA